MLKIINDDYIVSHVLTNPSVMQAYPLLREYSSKIPPKGCPKCQLSKYPEGPASLAIIRKWLANLPETDAKNFMTLLGISMMRVYFVDDAGKTDRRTFVA